MMFCLHNIEYWKKMELMTRSSQVVKIVFTS